MAGPDRVKIQGKLLAEVCRILKLAEAYLKHESISSTGGFSFILNGVKVIEVRETS